MPTLDLPTITRNMCMQTSILVGNIRNLINAERTLNMHRHYLKHQISAIYEATAITAMRTSWF